MVPPTIQSATVFVDNQNGVLRISPPAGFVGSTTITVTADDTSGPVSRSFTVNVVADGINDRPFLGHIPDVTTSRGTAVTIDLPATDLENDPLTFVVRDPNNFANNPPNVTVSINQTARRATITPNPGFVGTVEMLVGVRDQIPRDGNPDLNARSQFDTQRVTLTVTGAVDLDADSDTGLFNDDNYTNDSTPSFTIYAPPGQTVQVQVNGGPALGTSETSPGIYRVTLPAGQVQVGHNVITATANGEPVGGPMTFTYAPSQLSFYVVPGAPGTPQTVTFEHVSSESAFRNELGAFVVDDFEGRVNGLLPNAPGYAQAALSSPSRQVLVARNAPVGATASMNLQGGQILGFYLIQNGTTAQFLAGNPTNSLAGNGPVAFFSFIGANPDGVRHAQAVGDPTQGRVIYGWEDLTGGGDSDYNDNVILVRTAGTAAAADEALRVPAGPGRDVTLSFQLQTALTSQLNSNPTLQRPTAAGEFGFFRVDDATGRIGDLSPGDAGYAQAALLARTAIFAFGTPALSTQTVTLPGGTLIGFYLIPGSSAADFLATNPSNAVNGSPVAFFSFDAANPDNGREHFRSYSPERISRPLPDVDSPIRIHALDQLFGTSADYDDLLVTLLIAP
ncbi:MAG: DUF4114 domain-containing protein [Gemmataceae bacterium]|nr:DUF4114 domain-containing protein [Gemmataceae bacterium]